MLTKPAGEAVTDSEAGCGLCFVRMRQVFVVHEKRAVVIRMVLLLPHCQKPQTI